MFIFFFDEFGYSRFVGWIIIYFSLYNVLCLLYYKIFYCCVWLYWYVFWVCIDFYCYFNFFGKSNVISWLLCYWLLSNRIYVVGIVLLWILVVMVMLIRFLLYFFIIIWCYFVIFIIIFLSSLFIIMICCYCFIWKNIKFWLLNLYRIGSDEKLIKILMKLIVCFLVMWLFFEVLIVFFNLCVFCW